MRIFVASLFLFASALSANIDFQTVIETNADGNIFINDYADRLTKSTSETTLFNSFQNPSSGIIWSYSVASGLTGKNTSIGNGSGQVFAGTWYGGAKMFTGTGGTGSVNWETPQPPMGTNQTWRSWATRAASSKTSDIFYSLSSWETWDDMGTPGTTSDDTLISKNFQVSKYNHSSATPEWTYNGTDYFLQGSIDDPGKVAVSDDGSVLAVTGTIADHLAVLFFSDTSSTPIMIYENSGVAYSGRQLRLTSDGTKCIFSCGAVLYRVDIATGTLEANHNLGASTDCFGISGDGSIVSYGFTSAYIAQWNGASYSVIHSFPVSGYYAGSSAISQNGNYVYFGFYKNTYLSNRIYCYDVSQSTLVMTYDYPVGGGANQDIVSWMECSQDGTRLVVGSWGCQSGGGDEIEVFDLSNPTAPVFSINAPGSVFHVTITPDGHYVSGTGKHVHANVMGSGIDLYFAEVDLLSVEEEPSQLTETITAPFATVLSNGTVMFSFGLSSASDVTLDLYSVNGSKILNIVDSYLCPGNHSFIMDTDLADGVYFFRVSADRYSVSEKFYILK